MRTATASTHPVVGSSQGQNDPPAIQSGPGNKGGKSAVISGCERFWDLFARLITVTLVDGEHLWAQVCGRGLTVFSSERVTLPCDEAWPAVQKHLVGSGHKSQGKSVRMRVYIACFFLWMPARFSFFLSKNRRTQRLLFSERAAFLVRLLWVENPQTFQKGAVVIHCRFFSYDVC